MSLEERIIIRRKKLRTLRNSPEWKDARAAFLLEHPICSWCGKKANTPHHPIEDMYTNYLDLSGCVPFCNRCHFAAHRGLVLCPVCKEHYMKRDNPNEKCRECMGDTWKEKRDAAKVQRNKKKREIERKRYRDWKRKCGKT